MAIVDTHAHLDFEQFDGDRETVIANAAAAGVTQIITIGTDLPTSRTAAELAGRFDGVYAAIGVHPHDASQWDRQSSPGMLEDLAKGANVVAIGECGLDYYRDRSPRDAQRFCFIDQIVLARRLKLPLVVHNRDAFDDILRVLVEHRAWEVGGVMHCFSGTVEQLGQTIDLGFYISVNGILTYKNSSMQDIALAAPRDKVLLETDCPFLTPVPHRGKRNEPAYTVHVAERYAELLGATVDEVAKFTTANARRLFRLPK